MKVIASIKYEDRKSRSRRITVRKCPPNYKPQEGEYVVELEDYTREDIKNYFEIDTQIPDKDEEVHEC